MDIEQTRKLAQDENTAIDILSDLAKNEDYTTRQYVAANPNTPIEVLLSICFEFPIEVINNPIIPLLILENPDCLTCELTLDFNKLQKLTYIEITRLGLNLKKEQVRNYLMKKYGKRSRLHLTDEELLDFLNYLRSSSINNFLPVSEKTNQQSSIESWDEIPF